MMLTNEEHILNEWWKGMKNRSNKMKEKLRKSNKKRTVIMNHVNERKNE